jgi:hypothetical protein
MMKRLFFVAALAVGLAGCADFSGHWEGTWAGEGADSSGTLILQLNHGAGALAGTINAVGMSCVQNSTLTGEAGGSSATLTVANSAPNSPTGEALMTMDAKIENGDKMTGTWQLQGRCGAAKGTFAVTRQ